MINWESFKDYEDITFKVCKKGVARIAFNRPEVRSNFSAKDC